MADDPSEVSGIFTTQDEDNSSFGGVAARRKNNDDNASDIVSGYPGLDDESLIVSEAGGVVVGAGNRSNASSGVYTEPQPPTQASKGSANKATTNSGSYNVENSSGNTNEIMGGYANLDGVHLSASNKPDEKKSNSWLSDAFQLFGLPISTMPTAKSTPDKATDDQHEVAALYSDVGDEVSALTPVNVATAGAHEGAAGAAGHGTARTASGTPASSSNQEVSKLCGMSSARVIVLSGALVIIALVIVVVAVVVSNNNDDDGSSGSQPGLVEDPDFEGFLTFTPTASPSVEDDGVVVIPDCPPDDDSETFLVTSEVVDCVWLRSREQVFVEVLCETREDIANACRTTCLNCATQTPSSAPVTAMPTVSPSAQPTLSPLAVGETRAPSPEPTFSPTAQPTTRSPSLAPSPGPTTLPPSPSPTASPVSSPTSAPVAAPTSAPVSSPTSAPNPIPTTPVPTTLVPTALPTIEGATAQPSTQAPTLGPSTEFPTRTVAPTPSPTTSPTFVPTVTANCDPDLPGTIPNSPPSWTCQWLANLNNPSFRRNQCQEGFPAATHCPTTCRVCVEDWWELE